MSKHKFILIATIISLNNWFNFNQNIFVMSVPGLTFHPTNSYAFVESDPDNIDLLPIITINGMTLPQT